MRAITIDKEYGNLSEMLQNLRVTDRPLRELKDNELLVKMEGAPCNPSDIAFLRGMYQIKKDFPAVPGFEGSGIIIACGKNLDQSALTGKRISCFIQDNDDGTWAEYFIAKADNCLLLRDDFPKNEAPVFFINPFTAYGLFQTALDKGDRTIVLNAAAGQVGGFIRQFAKESGIKVINIVRRPQHVEKLKQEGETLVLNMRDKNFRQDSLKMFNEYQPETGFDAVAGDQTSFLLEIMPRYAEIVVYGGLSGNPLSVDVLKLIFESKRISGFNLGDWIRQTGRQKLEEISDKLQQMFIDGILRTRIQKTITFDEIQQGLYQYLTKMSDGKVIIRAE
ncbi:MAG TPA: zinc-binding dehydrogenase [Bacteroidia bacterium]|nr:zinc-binding dehydrogenase [Bacteroidia bacterium]HRS58271.1 zinc-binding dehydrogenase [Bacteroidia bacterium]HRU67703.1 zinc-binding dehydrogenase [Bacteroidia bacterium]